MPSSTPPPLPLMMERPAAEEATHAINAQPRIATNALPEDILKAMAAATVGVGVTVAEAEEPPATPPQSGRP